MELIVYFDHHVLNDLKNEISDISNLYNIGLFDFVQVVGRRLRKHWIGKISLNKLKRMLIFIYDCIDCDSRGIIHWDDFVTFCLRMGRKQFKQNSSHSNLEYFQRMDVSPVVPVKQLFFCVDTNTLYAYDGENPIVRLFTKDGELISTYNPVDNIVRHLRRLALGNQPYYAKKQALKQDAISATVVKKPSPLKGTILSMTYIDRKRQLVFSTSDGFVSFYDAGLTHLIGYIQVVTAQVGIYYCKHEDVLISWAGNTTDNFYRVWDINSRTIRYKFKIHSHSNTILTTISIPGHRLMASSSLDRSVVVWSSFRLKQESTGPLYRETYLKGHSYAIRSLAYAPDNDMLIGAGFDFDVYVWDMTSKQLHSTLVGHRQSVVGVATIYNPLERAATIDEGGTLKVWNIHRSQSLRGQLLQTLMTAQSDADFRVVAFVPLLKNGTALAALEDQLQIYEVSNGAVLDENRVVPGGLILGGDNNKVWVITRKYGIEKTFGSGEEGKVFDLISDDRADACLTAKVVEGFKGLMDAQQSLLPHSKSLHISAQEEASVATCDFFRKKLVLGTQGGRILLYDNVSLGLLSQRTIEDATFHDSGPVICLRYCSRDELVIAAYGNGALKIYSCCHRLGPEIAENLQGTPKCTTIFQGGNTPTTPFLLRVNRCVHESSILQMAVSEELGLIAISGSDGSVRILDYYTLLLKCVFAAPNIAKKPIECVLLTFVPYAPLLLGADSLGRISAWLVFPEKPTWVITFSMSNEISFSKAAPILDRKILQHASSYDGDEPYFLLAPKSANDDEDPFAGSGVDGDEHFLNDGMPSIEEPILEYEVGIGISSMEAVIFEKASRDDKEKKKKHWHLVVGDEYGRISTIDITILVKYVGYESEESVYKYYETHILNRNQSPYGIVFRNDYKEGVEEWQLANITAMLKRPVGSAYMSPLMSRAYLSEIKGKSRWMAHAPGVNELVILQNLEVDDPRLRNFPKKNVAGGSEKVNSTVANRMLRFPPPPHGIVSVSEYSSSKVWTYQGVPIEDSTSHSPHASTLKLKEHEHSHIHDKISVDGAREKRTIELVSWFEKNKDPMYHDMFKTTDASTGVRLDRPISPSNQGRTRLNSNDSEGLNMNLTVNSEKRTDEDTRTNTNTNDDIFSLNNTSLPNSPREEASSTLERKVKEAADKQKDTIIALRNRRTETESCWNSKIRFPNLKSEQDKKIHKEEKIITRSLFERSEASNASPSKMREPTPTENKIYEEFRTTRNLMRESIKAKVNRSRSPTKLSLSMPRPSTAQTNFTASTGLNISASSPALNSPGFLSEGEKEQKFKKIRERMKEFDLKIGDTTQSVAEKKLNNSAQKVRPSTSWGIREGGEDSSSAANPHEEGDRGGSGGSAHNSAGKDLLIQLDNHRMNTSKLMSGLRYGPYKVKDILAFEDMMSRLPINKGLEIVKSMMLESSQQGSGTVHTTLDRINMNTLYLPKEVVASNGILYNKQIAKMFLEMKTRANGCITRLDIFEKIFMFASMAERSRIYNFIIVRSVMLDVLKALQPPAKYNITSKHTNFGAKDSATTSQPRVFFKDMKVGGATETNNTPAPAVNVVPLRVARQGTFRHKMLGLEYWRISRYTYDDLKKVIEDVYESPDGTVTGSELLDIVQSSGMLTANNFDKSASLHGIAARKGFSLSSEVNAATITTLMEDILKIRVVDNLEDNLNEEINLALPSMWAGVKQSRKFSLVMKESLKHDEFGAFTNGIMPTSQSKSHLF